MEDGGQWRDDVPPAECVKYDFIVDSLEDWWEQLPLAKRDDLTLLQIKLDNDPESNGRRPPFRHRMVAFADNIGKRVQLINYPLDHIRSNSAGDSGAALERYAIG